MTLKIDTLTDEQIAGFNEFVAQRIGDDSLSPEHREKLFAEWAAPEAPQDRRMADRWLAFGVRTANTKKAAAIAKVERDTAKPRTYGPLGEPLNGDIVSASQANK